MIGGLYVNGKKETQLLPVVNKPVSPPVVNWTVDQAKAIITDTEGKQILNYLCSDELEGRMSGQPGNDKAAKWIADYFKQCGVEPGNNGSYFQSFTVDKVNDHKKNSTGVTNNIIGVLPGNDPVLKNEYIIIGAHMDHIGYGPSYSQSPNRREIHPGADDNATGTSLVMQCAKALAKLKGKIKRTIVFICFSGEEMGLIGANYYCQHPVYPLDKTVIMINQDMIGRYNNQGRLTCSGAGKCPLAVRAIDKIKKDYPFQVSITSDSGGGSDHAAFIRRRVNVCMFHTGQHNQYHTPDDTPDRIDFQGLTLISKFVFQLAYEISIEQ